MGRAAERLVQRLLGILALVLAGLGPAQAEPLRVFAAASLGEVLDEIADGWDAPVVLSLGGSGTIARQVDQGAPADVVVLANPVWMAWLDGRGRLIADTLSEPFGNRLALAGSTPLPALTVETMTAVLGPRGRLAMGDQRAVPAGQYAKAWLQTAGVWEAVQGQLAETENVRAALALVARGEAPLGIVYKTDLRGSDVTEVWQIPDADQPDIRYAVAAVTEAGRGFAAALSQPDAQTILARYGFLTEDAK